MSHIPLSPAQQAVTDRIHATLTAAGDLRDLAELLASKADDDLLGPTEFQVRDLVPKVGAKAIETSLAERKKGCTTAPAGPALPAGRRPSSSAGGPGPS
jgi:hypothetical protein